MGAGRWWLALSVLVAWSCGGSPTAPTPTPTPTPTPPPALGLTCPAAVEVQAQSANPVTVQYQAPVASGGTAPVATVCSPASGSAFPVGTATVTCEATDAAAQRASCSFPVTVRPRPPAPRLAATTFLAFGDSITEGVTSFTPLAFAAVSYPATLQALLSARYYDQTITVANAGVAGELATEGLERLPGVLGSVHPQAVLLMEGVNELNQYHERGINPAVEAIEDMTRQAQGSGARVFLATLLQERAGGSHACCIAYLDAYNAEMRGIATRYGADLVDLHALVDVSLIGADGLHPTEAGYQRIAEVYFDAIRKSLEQPTTNGRR